MRLFDSDVFLMNTYYYLVPPSFNDSSNRIKVSASINSEVNLTCLPSGYPKPSIRWYRREKPITHEEDLEILSFNHVQVIISLNISSQSIFMTNPGLLN